MDTLVSRLEKNIGPVSMTRVPEKLNPFPGDMETWLVRADLFPRGISIKGLAAESIYFNAKETGALDGKNTVIVCSSANFAIAMALTLPKHLQLIAIVPPSIEKKKRDRLLSLGVRIEESKNPFELADKLAQQPGALHLDQYSDLSMTRGVETYLAPLVRRQVKYTHVFLPLGTGGTAIGFDAYHKNHGIDAMVVGVNLLPGDTNKISGMRDPERQQEVSLPWRKSLFAGPISVGRVQSLRWAEAMRDCDIMVGTSSGAPLAALRCWMQLTEDITKKNYYRNADGKIVAVMICPDSVFAFA